VGEIQEPVADTLPLRRLDVDLLQRGRIAIQPHRHRQRLLVHELVQALHRSGGSALDLDRNDAAVDFHEVVDLRTACTLPAPVVHLAHHRRSSRCGPQLLGGELLGQSPAHLWRQLLPAGKSACCRRVPQPVCQADVEQRHFADALVRLGGQGDAAGGAVRNQLAQPRHGEQFHGLPCMDRFHAFSDPGVYQFVTQRGDYRTQHRIQQAVIQASRVLGEIVAIGLDQIPLPRPALVGVGTGGIQRDHRGHAAYHGEAFVPRGSELVHRIRDGRAGVVLDKPVLQGVLPVGAKKLGEGQRFHVSVLNAAHRHAVCKVAKRKFEQRACRDYREFRQLLGEPPQPGKYFGGVLNFVDEQDRPARCCAHVQRQAEVVEDAPRVGLGEVAGQPGVALQVHLQQHAALALGEVPHQPSLAHLPGPANHQRQPRTRSQPALQKCREAPIHAETIIKQPLVFFNIYV